jgi:serine/threonine protein kinase
MREMHELGILHRDIKNANILLHIPEISTDGARLRGSKLIKRVSEMLEKNNTEVCVYVKLGDFGFAT